MSSILYLCAVWVVCLFWLIWTLKSFASLLPKLIFRLMMVYSLKQYTVSPLSHVVCLALLMVPYQLSGITHFLWDEPQGAFCEIDHNFQEPPDEIGAIFGDSNIIYWHPSLIAILQKWTIRCSNRIRRELKSGSSLPVSAWKTLSGYCLRIHNKSYVI